MHISVLLKESIESLNIKEDSVIVDCTLGYAGHSSEILKRIPKGYLYAFDQDKEAITFSQKKLSSIAPNFEIIDRNFTFLKEELEKRNQKEVDGILFDLGVSSPQLDEDYRGFSFHKDAPLDMRMDQRKKLTAKTVVNTYSKQDLIHIFQTYGEEKYAKPIAQAIIEYRENKEIETTLELAELVKNNVPFKYRREKHPARKVFQAIRIEVNQELDVFRNALEDAFSFLSIGGRICVITFHSLEDHICKEFVKKNCKVKKELQKLPILPEEYQPKFKEICVIEPTEEEKEKNPRSRSARLHVIERIK